MLQCVVQAADPGSGGEPGPGPQNAVLDTECVGTVNLNEHWSGIE